MVWGVVTNKHRRFTLPLTATMPMFRRAGVIVSGDSTPYSKPHPTPILEAMRQLDVEAGDCLYVGDDERDMLAGRAAGVATVAASYGYLGPDASIERWPADAVIHRPADLLKLIDLA